MKSNRKILIGITIILGIISLIMFSAGCQGSQTPVTSPSQSQTTTSPANPSTSTQPSATATPTNSSTPDTPSTNPVSTPPTSTVTGTATSPAQSTTTPPASLNIIVNHSNWDWYKNQSQQVLNAVASQSYFFAHASVGANIVNGLKALNSSDPARYPLKITGSNGSVPASTVKGTFYEYARGNPGWAEKVQGFETNVKNGWHGPAVEVAMYKFCYIDPTADFGVYRDSMVNLEKLYPDTHFVYWTMPIKTGGDLNERVLRTKFNQNLRDWIATQENKILFDLADIETWGPSGEHDTTKTSGITCDLLYKGYTSDGGHLNEAGSARVADALYSLFGLLTNP